MIDRSFTTRFTVTQTPDAVMTAIADVRGWWSEEITGDAGKVGDRFTHTVLDLHRCDLAVVEKLPGEKMVWTVLDNYFSFTRDATEWTGTDIVFEIAQIGDETEIRFTHVGLVPEYECHAACTDGWTFYIGSLRDLITTGKGQPNVGEAKTNSEMALAEMREPSHAAS